MPSATVRSLVVTSPPVVHHSYLCRFSRQYLPIPHGSNPLRAVLNGFLNAHVVFESDLFIKRYGRMVWFQHPQCHCRITGVLQYRYRLRPKRSSHTTPPCLWTDIHRTNL